MAANVIIIFAPFTRGSMGSGPVFPPFANTGSTLFVKRVAV